MTQDPPAWLGEDDEDRPARGRRWVLAAIATIPWLVVLALLLSGSVRGLGASGPEGAHPKATVDGTADRADPPAASSTAGPPDGSGRHKTAAADVGEVSGPPQPGAEGHVLDVPGIDPAVAALAKTVARAWLTDVGPRLQIEGIQPQADHYLEQAMVEAVHEHDGLAVAIVLALVLERDGERYVDVALRRLAVPVHLTDSGPRPGGQPWWLPDPELRPHLPEPTPEHDPDLALAIAELLAEHAYEDVEVTRLGRHGRGWLIAEGTARLPDGRTLLGPLWLRETPTGPRLLDSAAATPDQGERGPPIPTGDHHDPTPDLDPREEQP
jgi:hypothetical protein